MTGELQSYEPATGATHWRGKCGDVDTEVALARAAWPAWVAQPLASRIEAIHRFANRVAQDSEKIANLIARETGKPMWEARIEVESVGKRIDTAIRAYADRSSQRRIDGALQGRNALRHKPHGALGVITAFNAPLAIPVAHIIPALLAGNAVIFKPSEYAPATGEHLVAMLQGAGVATGALRLLVGGPAQGEALAGHPGIDGLLFTGSTQTGLQINRVFASQPHKLLVLEMGGNNPIVVWDTLDIHSAAVIVAQSAFTSAGQSCTAASRLIVKSNLYAPLVEEVKKLAGRLIVGEPHDNPAPFMGPVIDNVFADGLVESFVILMSNGGKVIRHMTRPIENRPFLTPGIIDVTDMPDRPDIELFGPLLQVIRVASFEEAIAEANNSRYGLCASLIGGSAAQYDQFWANVRAGVINWNRPTIGESISAPFGGVGLSGNHRPSNYYAADYSAYPVSSTEAETIRASIGVGLRPMDVSAQVTPPPSSLAPAPAFAK